MKAGVCAVPTTETVTVIAASASSVSGTQVLK